MHLRVRSLVTKEKNKVPWKTHRTEDGIAVYNVVIENLPKNVCKKRIFKTLIKYGKIKHIEITRGKTRSQPARCYIYFESSSGAAAALKNCYKKVSGKRITIRACPSWEQPFRMDADETLQQNGVSLVSLNDYCLEMIFKQLDLLQQVRLSLCHERLEQIFVRMVCPKFDRHLSLSQFKKFSMWETRQFFRTAGKTVLSLEIPEYCGISHLTKFNANSTVYDLIAENCVQVQRVKVVCRSFIYMNLLNVLNLNSLNELELYDCHLTEENLCVVSNELRNLTALSLACNPNIRGVQLPRLRRLKRLSLYQCDGISEDALWETCRTLQLNYLDLRRISSVPFLGSLVGTHCPELETLRVGNYEAADLNGFKRLPKLKSLEIQNSCQAMPVVFYSALAEQHAGDLEELKIYGNVSLVPTVNIISGFKNLRVLWLHGNAYNISRANLLLFANLTELEEINLDQSNTGNGKHLLPLVRNCMKLKRMSLRYCWQVNNKFVRRAISILEKRTTHTSSTPLFMLLYRTCVSSEFLNSRKYQNSRNIVRVSLENPKPLQGLISERSIFDFEIFGNTGSSKKDFRLNNNDGDSDDLYDDDDDDDYDDDYDDDDDDQSFYFGMHMSSDVSSSGDDDNDDDVGLDDNDVFFVL